MDVKLYLRNSLAYSDQTWCVMTAMIWGYLHSSPSGQKIEKMAEQFSKTELLNSLAKKKFSQTFPILAILGAGHFEFL